MKKKWLVICGILVFLWGCQAPAEPETLPATEPEGTVAVTEPAAVPSGSYIPGSDMELATSGAVRVYSPGLDHITGIGSVGDDILIFSGADQTTLTLLKGDDRYIHAQITLPFPVSPDDPSVAVSDRGVACFDPLARELLCLDQNLQEVSRVGVPEDVSGTVVLAPGGAKLYYSTVRGIRVLNPDTGRTQLLTELPFPQHCLAGIHCGGAVLECTVTDTDGTVLSCFLSAETGRFLHGVQGRIPLWTDGDFYLALVDDGHYQQLLAGSSHFGPSVLVTGHCDPQFLPVAGTHALLLITHAEHEQSTQLDYFDLQSGAQPYRLELPGKFQPTDALADKQGNIWLSADNGLLCCWDPNQSPSGDGNTYLQSPSGSDSPDWEGLQQCRELAAQISEKHHVNILLWTDATAFQPPDVLLTAEHQAPFLAQELNRLDALLSRYPEDFLKEAAQKTASGRIQICLVRAIEHNGTPVGSLQYWDNRKNACIAVTLGPGMEESLFHGLFYIINSRVLCTGAKYDRWSDLNPEKFEYGCSKSISQALLDGDERAFIGPDSTVSPLEDRASMMLQAMMPNNETLFSSRTMQKKLRLLCLGIREAFGPEAEAGDYLWEQYLIDPIQKKK